MAQLGIAQYLGGTQSMPQRKSWHHSACIHNEHNKIRMLRFAPYLQVYKLHKSMACQIRLFNCEQKHTSVAFW